MAEVLLFHHALGLTRGVRAFAGELGAAGHVVNAPDLFDGRTFADVSQGVAFADEIGFAERGRALAEDMPNDIIHAGFSLGVLPAQMLAQTRPGARGALLFSSYVPPTEFGRTWPEDVPVQVHLMDRDEFALEGDLDAARNLAATTEGAELFLYPGDRHLFADSSVADHDEGAATLLKERTRAFLDGLG
jgi:dienelactone hydrolase